LTRGGAVELRPLSNGIEAPFFSAYFPDSPRSYPPSASTRISFLKFAQQSRLVNTYLDCCANFRNEILGEAGGG
jgi:hypothetical protein